MDGRLLRFDVVGMSRVGVRSVGQVPDASLNFSWVCILEGGARREDLAETLQSAPVLITVALRITVTQPSHDASLATRTSGPSSALINQYSLCPEIRNDLGSECHRATTEDRRHP